MTTGEAGPGMFAIVSGEVAVTQQGPLGRAQLIVTHGPGSLMGELAQLSGRPSLVDAQATRPVDALVIPSRRLPEVLVAEAEVGERIMRALILRRVGLLESGISGPVIVGRAGDSDALRLAGFLSRIGHPYQRLDPDTDACATALRLEPSQLPIVVCPNDRMLRNPSEAELAACLGLLQRIDSTKVYDVAIVGAGPAGLAAAVYGASAVHHRPRQPRLRRAGGRVGADRELPRVSDRHHRHGADGPRLHPGAEVRRRDGDP